MYIILANIHFSKGVTLYKENISSNPFHVIRYKLDHNNEIMLFLWVIDAKNRTLFFNKYHATKWHFCMHRTHICFLCTVCIPMVIAILIKNKYIGASVNPDTSPSGRYF